MGSKSYAVRTNRSIKEIATIVKRTCEDPRMLGILRINLMADTGWTSVPTDSSDHGAFAVMETEPDWNTRFFWQDGGAGWFTVDFVANEDGNSWNVTATARTPAGALGSPAHKIAKKVVAQL